MPGHIVPQMLGSLTDTSTKHTHTGFFIVTNTDTHSQSVNRGSRGSRGTPHRLLPPPPRYHTQSRHHLRRCRRTRLPPGSAQPPPPLPACILEPGRTSALSEGGAPPRQLGSLGDKGGGLEDLSPGTLGQAEGGQGCACNVPNFTRAGVGMESQALGPCFEEGLSPGRGPGLGEGAGMRCPGRLWGTDRAWTPPQVWGWWGIGARGPHQDLA